jgi:hypothetical protein
MFRLFTRVFAVALVCALSAAAYAQKPSALPDEKSTGDWYEFFFHGQKVGFSYTERSPTTVNDRPATHVKQWIVIKVRRTQQPIHIESVIDAWSEPDGKPMRYTHTRQEGGDTRTSEGYRDGNTFVVRHAVGTNLKERKIALEPNTIFATSMTTQILKDLKVGKELKGKAIIEEDGEVKDFTIKVLSAEKRPEGPAFVVESQVSSIVSKEIILANGTTLELSMEALGAKLVRSTREKALVIDEKVDLFAAAQFGVKRPLPPNNELEEIVVRMRGQSGKAPKVLFGGRQKGKPSGKDAVEVHVAALDAPVKAPRLPITDAKMKPFLKETSYEPLSDEKLKGTVARVVGDEKDAWLAAKKINSFVYGHIKQKTLARAFATATEALETGEGDCTEHAVLFSALAKIAGIPTRLLTGLVYVGGRNNLFGYHNWVEVWMGDRWVAMDPTFGQDLADATHITFTQGLSDSDGLREAGLAAASLIGELQLEVVEYTTSDGKKQKM